MFIHKKISNICDKIRQFYDQSDQYDRTDILFGCCCFKKQTNFDRFIYFFLLNFKIFLKWNRKVFVFLVVFVFVFAFV